MKHSKAIGWMIISIASIGAMMLIVLGIAMCVGGFSRTFMSIKDHIWVAFANEKYVGESFLEDRTFSKDDVITSSFDKSMVDKSGGRPFSVSMESFVNVSIELNSSTVYGPWGIKIDFEEGTPASEYGLGDGYVMNILPEKSDADDIVRLVHYNDSYIYLLKSTFGKQDEIALEIAGDIWDDLDDNHWSISIMNGDGTLMSKSGFFELLILLKEYRLKPAADGIYTVIGEEYKAYTYKISANCSDLYCGILQKNGAQDDYRFLLSLLEYEDMMIPRSDKINLPSDGVMKFGVCSSERFKYKDSVMKLYKVNEKTGETTLCHEYALKRINDDWMSEIVEVDFKGLESGVYRITLEGKCNTRLLYVSSVREFFQVVIPDKTVEVYEYYFKIGELQ